MRKRNGEEKMKSIEDHRQTYIKRHFEVRKGHFTFKFYIRDRNRYQVEGKRGKVELRKEQIRKQNESIARLVAEYSSSPGFEEDNSNSSCHLDSSALNSTGPSHNSSWIKADLKKEKDDAIDTDGHFPVVDSTGNDSINTYNKSNDRSAFSFLETVKKISVGTEQNSAAVGQSTPNKRKNLQIERTERLNAAAQKILKESVDEENESSSSCPENQINAPIEKKIKESSHRHKTKSKSKSNSQDGIKKNSSGEKDTERDMIIKKDIELINRYSSLMPPEIGSLVKQKRTSSRPLNSPHKVEDRSKNAVKTNNIKDRTPYYKCKKCDKMFKNVQNIQRHIALHKQQFSRTCQICDKAFDSEESWEIHSKVHAHGQDEEDCDDVNQEKCGQDSSGSKPGKTNKGISSSVAERVKCENRIVCKRTIPDIGEDTGFMDNSLSKTCDSVNQDSQSIKLSSSVNESTDNDKTKEDEIKCNICNAEFKYRRDLQRHMREHTGEKLITCKQCNSHFSHRGNLQKHIRNIHEKHPSERKYKRLQYSCEFCGKVFSNKPHLLRHMATHTGEKKYACNRCKKKFAYKSGLQRHMRLHDGRSMPTCNICNKRFFDMSTLKSHMRSHTGETPYSCEKCNLAFQTKSSLNVHTKKHH